MPIIAIALLLLVSCTIQNDSKPKIRFVDNNGNPKQIEIKKIEMNSRSMNQQRITSDSKLNAENKSLPTISSDKMAPVYTKSDSDAQMSLIKSEIENPANPIITKSENSKQDQQPIAQNPVDVQIFTDQSINQKTATSISEKNIESAPKPVTVLIPKFNDQTSKTNLSSENDKKNMNAPSSDEANQSAKEILFKLDDVKSNQDDAAIAANDDIKPKSGKIVFTGNSALKKAFTAKKPEAQKFYVQIGSFLQREKARNLIEEMRKIARGKVETSQNADRITYRALLGPFTNKSDAKSLAAKIRENGQDAILVKSN